jgi:hypothetical protein
MQKAFDLSEWAAKNLDQEIVSKNVKDMEAFQMELQDRCAWLEQRYSKSSTNKFTQIQ